MSANSPRAPGSFLRVRKGILERQCKDCRRWHPQTTGHFMLQNRALIRKEGKEPRQVWDCRCWPCSRKVKKTHRTNLTIRHYADRGPRSARPVLPAIPPRLDLSSILSQLLECPQRHLEPSRIDPASLAWGDDD